MGGITRISSWNTALIEDGETTSTALDIRNMAFLGAILPATFDGTGFSFTVSHDNVTYYPLSDVDGAAIAVASVAAGDAIDLPTELAAWPWIKLVSNGAQSGADATIVVVMKA